MVPVPLSTLRRFVPFGCQRSDELIEKLNSLRGDLSMMGWNVIGGGNDFEVADVIVARIMVDVMDVVTGRNLAVGVLPDGSVHVDTLSFEIPAIGWARGVWITVVPNTVELLCF